MGQRLSGNAQPCSGRAGLAQIEARTGQVEEAVKIPRQLTRLKIDPVWDPIRNNPDFQKLISEPEPETVYK